MSWFYRNPLQNSVLSIIIGIHIIFSLILFVSPSFVFRKKTHKSLVVKTIVPKTHPIEKKSPAPKASSPVQKAAPPLPKKQEAQKVQAPSKKEAPAAKTVAPKPATSTKKEPAVADKQVSKSKQVPPAKKNPPPQNRAKISDSLLKELEESIANIENKKSVARPASPSKTIAPFPLQIDLMTSSGHDDVDTDYAELLVGHLHQSLRLPDYGEVKIQLSLRQDGSVVKVVVLKTQSEKNRQYLESNLSKLKFPRFEGSYSNKKECTFILTFCNE